MRVLPLPPSPKHQLSAVQAVEVMLPLVETTRALERTAHSARTPVRAPGACAVCVCVCCVCVWVSGCAGVKRAFAAFVCQFCKLLQSNQAHTVLLYAHEHERALQLCSALYATLKLQMSQIMFTFPSQTQVHPRHRPSQLLLKGRGQIHSLLQR